MMTHFLFSFFMLITSLVFAAPTPTFELSSQAGLDLKNVDPRIKEYVKKIPSSWNFEYEKEGVVVFSKKVEGDSLMAFKGVAIINESILKVLQVLRNVEDSHLWTPSLRIKEMAEEYDYLNAVTYSITELPWPADPRDSLMHTILKVIPEMKAMNVYSTSSELEKYPPVKGIVRAIVHESNFYLYPLGESQTLMDLDALVDPKGMIPTSLANFVQKKWPYNFVTSLEKRTHEVGPDFHPLFIKAVSKIVSKKVFDKMLSVVPSDKRK